MLLLDCGYGPTPANGRVNYTCVIDGCTALVECDPGYYVVGAPGAACTNNGWSSNFAQCYPIGKVMSL